MATRNIVLTGPQSKAFKSLKPVTDINLPWGRGCGKSWFLRFCTWFLAVSYAGIGRLELLARFGITVPDPELVPSDLRGVRVVWLMPTLKQFKAVHGSQFRQEAGDYARAIERTNWTDYRIDLKGGGWIQPFPAELHNSEFARGLRADAVVVDECDDVEIAVFNAVIRPWFSEPWSLKIRLTGGTPKRGRHGLLYQRHRAGLDAARERYVSVFATYRDNPEIVDEKEVADAKADTPRSVFAREWECDFDSAEGLVYGGVFDQSVTIRTPPDPDSMRWSEMLIGIDHGWEHPGVFLLIGVAGNGKDAIAWVLEEVFAQHRDEGWWKKQLSNWLREYPSARVYADPSMPSRVDAYRSGCRARMMDTDNSVEDGIASVANLMLPRPVSEESNEKRARLYISPSCHNLITELGGTPENQASVAQGTYRRKPNPRDPERFLDEVVKLNDDGCDALRYAIFNRFGPAPWSGRTTRHQDLLQ